MRIDVFNLDADHPLRKKVEEKLRSESTKTEKRLETPYLSSLASGRLQHTSTYFELRKVFHVKPMGKPRMSQSDKWKTDPNHPDPKRRQRKVVTKYIDFKRSIQMQLNGFEIPVINVWVIFHLPMPKSWTDKKKVAYRNEIHQQKPDKDNLEKALLDALMSEDKEIADSRITKLWCDRGRERIEIYY